jgi:hypothetical protein
MAAPPPSAWADPPAAIQPLTGACRGGGGGGRQEALERQIDGQRQKLSVWSSMLERGEQVCRPSCAPAAAVRRPPPAA